MSEIDLTFLILKFNGQYATDIFIIAAFMAVVLVFIAVKEHVAEYKYASLMHRLVGRICGWADGRLRDFALL
jgi:uncharacterized membrane protein